MSLDKPVSNKMIQTPPAKKGFHFANDGVYLAEFIEADTLEEATAIYQKTKRPLAQSTPAPLKEEEENTL